MNIILRSRWTRISLSQRCLFRNSNPSQAAAQTVNLKGPDSETSDDDAQGTRFEAPGGKILWAKAHTLISLARQELCYLTRESSNSTDVAWKKCLLQEFGFYFISSRETFKLFVLLYFAFLSLTEKSGFEGSYLETKTLWIRK
jgi:hypothetical protein